MGRRGDPRQGQGELTFPPKSCGDKMGEAPGDPHGGNLGVLPEFYEGHI